MYNSQYIKKIGIWRWLMRNFIRQWHKRVTRSVHRIRLPSGAEFSLPLESHLASEVYVSGGDIDLGSEAIFLSLVKEDAVVYDVGANVGYYSVYLSPKVSKCYAFEPSLKTAAVLRRVIAPYPKVIHVPLAVSSTTGVATFYDEASMEVSGLKARTRGAHATEVQVTTLDEFNLKTPETVDAIKIDVEGFDFEVIKGARRLLQRDQALVLTEAKPDAELLRFARDIDYCVYANVWDRDRRWYRTIAITDGSVATKMLFLVPKRLAAAFSQHAFF